MAALSNANETNALAALTRQAAPHVSGAIQKASAKTGVDFAYLVQQAKAESSFNPDAKARTSSATGLYQFIESTWLNTVKKHGHKHGLGQYADMISANAKVSDPAQRQEVLALRKDPRAAAMMAAELASDNKRFLEQNYKGEIGATELYFAHFMGAGGASAFLNAKDENPLAFGADLFPREARANRGVFYNPQTGQPRTLAEIYDFFDKKFRIEGGDVNAPGPRKQAAPVPGDSPLNIRRSLPAADPLAAVILAGAQSNSPLRLSGATTPLFPHIGGSALLAPHDIVLLNTLAATDKEGDQDNNQGNKSKDYYLDANKHS